MNLFSHDFLGTVTRLAAARDGWVGVYVDGRRVERVPGAAVQGLGLAPGVEWSRTLADACALAAETQRARRKGLALLRVKGRSAAELQARLTAAGFSAASAAGAVAALTAAGMVNDGALAEDVATRARAKGLSTRATADRMRAKGLAPPPEAGGALTEVDKATEVARNRAGRLPGSLSPQARARRLIGALARLGYEEDLAREAVERVLGFQD